jgi:hypothetical protein
VAHEAMKCRRESSETGLLDPLFDPHRPVPGSRDLWETALAGCRAQRPARMGLPPDRGSPLPFAYRPHFSSRLGSFEYNQF